jgi:hypothetical protein
MSKLKIYLRLSADDDVEPVFYKFTDSRHIYCLQYVSDT